MSNLPRGSHPCLQCQASFQVCEPGHLTRLEKIKAPFEGTRSYSNTRLLPLQSDSWDCEGHSVSFNFFSLCFSTQPLFTHSTSCSSLKSIPLCDLASLSTFTCPEHFLNKYFIKLPKNTRAEWEENGHASKVRSIRVYQKACTSVLLQVFLILPHCRSFLSQKCTQKELHPWPFILKFLSTNFHSNMFLGLKTDYTVLVCRLCCSDHHCYQRRKITGWKEALQLQNPAWELERWES